MVNEKKANQTFLKKILLIRVQNQKAQCVFGKFLHFLQLPFSVLQNWNIDLGDEPKVIFDFNNRILII